MAHREDATTTCRERYHYWGFSVPRFPEASGTRLSAVEGVAGRRCVEVGVVRKSYAYIQKGFALSSRLFSKAHN